MVEALIIVILLLGIAIGGGLSTRSLPMYWKNIENPQAVTQQPFNSTGFCSGLQKHLESHCARTIY